MIMKIDINTDFTLDTPHYWDGFWERYDGLGVGGSDPDEKSKALRLYHQIIWSRALPCGEHMNLQCGSRPYYLSWNSFHFSSDSIIASFRYTKYRGMLNEVAKAVPDYRAYVENYLHRAYTIGGMIIFPQHTGSINQARGINPRICDRWDLTLECIRRYYKGEDSPLYKMLLRDRGFFELFIDFKGYVDFFFLQDCVSEDYDRVRFWIGDGGFGENPLPSSVPEYLLWMERQMEFLENRNARIATSLTQ